MSIAYILSIYPGNPTSVIPIVVAIVKLVNRTILIELQQPLLILQQLIQLANANYAIVVIELFSIAVARGSKHPRSPLFWAAYPWRLQSRRVIRGYCKRIGYSV